MRWPLIPAALVLLAVVAVCATPAQAQLVDASLSIAGLPPEAATNRSVALLPIEVTFTIAQAVCLLEATYLADLTATVDAGDNLTIEAQVLPAQVAFTFGTPNTITGASRTQDAVVEVARGAVLDAALVANVTVTATITGMTGCGPTAQASGFGTTAQTQVTFEPNGPDAAVPAGGGQAMPAPSVAWVLAALVAGLAIARRATR